jgi:pilus assembly protein Flp/PilA
MLTKLLKDQSGATLIEYGMILALISIACLIAFQSLGLNLADVFNTAANAMSGA